MPRFVTVGLLVPVGLAIAVLGATPARAAPARAAPPALLDLERNLVGIYGGAVHTSIDAEEQIDARAEIGLFGRVGLRHRLALQLDLDRARHDDALSIYRGTASVLRAFGDLTRLVPMLRAGIGWDTARFANGTSQWAGHVELGALLEVRLDGGVVIGLDLNVGARGLPTDECFLVERAGGFAPRSRGCHTPVDEAVYRAAKLTLGFAF